MENFLSISTVYTASQVHVLIKLLKYLPFLYKCIAANAFLPTCLFLHLV